jgi:hypothetical protein
LAEFYRYSPKINNDTTKIMKTIIIILKIIPFLAKKTIHKGRTKTQREYISVKLSNRNK